MRLRTKLAAVAVGAAALAGSVGLTAAPAGATAPPTLYQILQAQGAGPDSNWYDFDILAAATNVALTVPGTPLALAADPNPVVNGTPVKLTAFIPNDRAFQALAADLFGWQWWFASEAQVLGKLASSLDAATLNTVILYHVVAGPTAINSATALSVPWGTSLKTVQGGAIKVYPIKWLGTAVLGDLDPNDVNPTLVRSKLDIQASNGIAHGISFVLRPVDL